MLPAQNPVYKASNWKAAVEQFLTPPGGAGAFVVQAVVAFPDAAAGQNLVRNERLTWAACNGKTITTTVNDKSIQQTFGAVESVDDDTIAIGRKAL